MRIRNVLEPLYKPTYRIYYPVGLFALGVGTLNLVAGDSALHYGIGSTATLGGGVNLLIGLRQDIRKYKKK